MESAVALGMNAYLEGFFEKKEQKHRAKAKKDSIYATPHPRLGTTQSSVGYLRCYGASNKLLVANHTWR